MYCCVPFCKSNRKLFSNIKISFHEFPVNEDLSRQWLRRIARKDFVPNDKSNSSVVCSKHFTPEDFVPHSKVSRLKKNAVPTVFPMYPPYALLPSPQNSSSLSSLNHVKKPYMRKNGSKNSRKIVDPAIVYNFEINSIGNKSPGQHNEDRVFIEEANKIQYNSSHLLQTLNHLKRLSTENSKIKNAKGIASNFQTTFTNNNSLKQPSVVLPKKDPTASNRSHSFANFNHMKIQFKEENETENSTKNDATGIVVDLDIISTNNNSPKQPSVKHVLSINESKKDHPAANNNHSSVCLNHPKKSSVRVSGSENLTEKDGTSIAFNSGMTFTYNNSLQHHSVVGVCPTNVANKDLPATKSSCSLIGTNHIQTDDTGNTFNSVMTSTNKYPMEQKKVNRVLTLNDLIHKNVTEKSREIRNLKSLLLKKNKKLKKMKEEINNLEEKVSLYETNDHHETLRKISALKENSPQSNFFMNQMDNFFKKRPTWRESTIRECASWIAFSPKSYDFVRDRKLMVLPCRTTLLKYAYSGEIKRQKMDTCHLGSCQAESPGKLATDNSSLEH